MKIITLAVALALPVSLLNSYAQDPAPAKNCQPKNMEQEHKQGGFHVLPPRAMEHLNLTDAQKTQIATLEADVKQKVEQILTPEQLEKLKQMHPPKKHDGDGPHQGAPGEKPPGQGPDAASN